MRVGEIFRAHGAKVRGELERGERRAVSFLCAVVVVVVVLVVVVVVVVLVVVVVVVVLVLVLVPVSAVLAPAVACLRWLVLVLGWC